MDREEFDDRLASIEDRLRALTVLVMSHIVATDDLDEYVTDSTLQMAESQASAAKGPDAHGPADNLRLMIAQLRDVIGAARAD